MSASRRLERAFEALPSWAPAWARDWRKVLPGTAIVLILLLVLLLTARPKSEESSALAGGTNPASSAPPGLATAPTGAVKDNIIKGAGVGGSSGTTTTIGGTTKTGPIKGAGTGLGAGGGGVTYKGVLDKTVVSGFTWQHEQCGNFFGPGIAAAFGVPQPNPQESIQASIEYFESYPQLAFPNLPPAIAKGLSPKTGYWGRRVKAILDDNGGPFCADKARATAVKLAEQDKVFGTVQIPNDGANEFIAPEMAARKRIDIGGPGFTRDMYRKWYPYVYDITFSGSDVLDAWNSWACRDLWGKKSFATGDPTTADKRRVFALVYPDSPTSKLLAKEARDGFKRCGGSFKVDLAYPTGIDQQPAAANNAIAQFKTNGVTTVYMLTDPVFDATLTSTATSQVFFPEWAVSSIGFNDIAFVVRHFYDEQQRKNVFGASHLVGSDRVPWSQTSQYKAWKKVRPNQEPPGDWNNWFLNIAVLYAGMAGAGPNLTPATFLEGQAKLCGPCARTSRKALYISMGPGDTTGVDDFTLVKFNTQKEDIYDPPDQYGRKQVGYWNFPEKGKRYLRTISRPEE